MIYSSYEFIFLFLPLVLAGFFLLARAGVRAPALAWLVLCSLFFYSWWNPRFLLLILISIGANYGIGLLLARLRAQGKESAASAALFTGVALNLAAIGYYKYAGFLAQTMNDLFGTGISLPPIVLPLAISFFTFQQITYLADVRRGETEEHDFVHYCLFVTFFPQLIAGPIVHHKEMLPQFKANELRFSATHFSVGLTFFAAGLFKKIVVADQLALHASPAFVAASQGTQLAAAQAWGGALSYTLQLYFDFSGYSDMAIGLARMFSIRLPQNFNSPYRAANIIDFWRRWHMTLSRFLRDYLYIPLGGNRHGKARRQLNLAITMLLGGLWHGAGWTFVFWGGLHGLYLMANHGWRAFRGERAAPGPLALTTGRLVTFFFVTIAWVFFRASDFASALLFLRSMFSVPHELVYQLGPLGDALRAMGLTYIGPLPQLSEILLPWALILAVVALWFVPNTQQWIARFEPTVDFDDPVLADLPRTRVYERLRWEPTTAWALWTGALACASLLALTRFSEFLYFQF